MKYLLAITLLTAYLFTEAQTDKAVLTNLVNEFLEKVESKEMHDRFWAEDLTYTSSAGERFGKMKIMEGFDVVSDEEGPTYSAEEIDIKLLDDVAIVTFKLVSKMPNGEMAYYYNSGTFQKRRRLWEAVNWHATKIPENKTK